MIQNIFQYFFNSPQKQELHEEIILTVEVKEQKELQKKILSLDQQHIKQLLFKELELEKQQLEKKNEEKNEEKKVISEFQSFYDLQEHALLEEKNKISMEIDLYIRKKKDFDGKYPLKYKYPINLIDSNGYFIKKICLLNGYNNITFIEFIKKQERFIITSNNKISLKYITPFQGNPNHRLFGHFKCNKCNKKWTSGMSWKNKWQKCKVCDSMIYPYDQRGLIKNEKS